MVWTLDVASVLIFLSALSANDYFQLIRIVRFNLIDNSDHEIIYFTLPMVCSSERTVNTVVVLLPALT